MPTLNLKQIGGLVKIEHTGDPDIYLNVSGAKIKFVEPNDGTSSVQIVIGTETYDLAAITDIQVNGTPVTDQADFETQIATVFPEANGGSGGSATLQEVFDVESGTAVLTDDNEILTGDFELSIVSGDSAAEYTEVSITKSSSYIFSQNADGTKGSTVQSGNDGGERVAILDAYDSDNSTRLKVLPAEATLTKNGSPFEATSESHIATKKYVDDRVLVENDFANDAAAEAGDIPVGGLYHTSGTVKIRLV